MDTAVNEDYGAFDRIKKRAWLFGSIGIWFLPLLWIAPDAYVAMTISGLAMGMLLFLMASGLTLIFGLMDVLNLAHGAFFAWGAYVGYFIFELLQKIGWIETGSIFQNVSGTLLALAAAIAVGGLLGLIIEWVIVRRVYGHHLKQILITLGAAMVLEEVIKLIWSPNEKAVLVPLAFQGSWDVADVVVSKYKILAIVVGLLVFGGIYLVLKKTKIGIIVRGGVENDEMVQALGYNISRIFTGVFMVGAALAAVGGVMWAMFMELISPAVGANNLIFALIVVIIGGLGSVTGSFLGAIMVGLAFNYVAFTFPPLALGVNILIMAIILLIRPKGLLGTG